MRTYVLPLAFALAANLLGPAAAFGGPIGVEFTGTWSFYDSFDQNPDFWNALNGSGIYDRSALTLSLVIDNLDADASAGHGQYAITSGTLHVGNVFLSLSPSYLDVSASDVGVPGASFSGPGAGSYNPYYWQFIHQNAALASDDLLSALSLLQAVPSLLLVGCNSPTCSTCLGLVGDLTARKVEAVPEPGTLAVLMSGLFIFVAHRGHALMRRPQGVPLRRS